MRRSRKVAGVAVAVGLVLSACTTDGQGPMTGGVAAEVAGTTISLDEVESMTDAYCMVLTAAGQVAPRADISQHMAVTLVRGAILDEFEMATEVQATDDPRAAVPGWADLTEDEQAEISDYLDLQSRMQAALIELAGEASADPEAAMAAGRAVLAERVADEVDVSINPRFDVEMAEGDFVAGGGELSVAVSDDATAAPDDMEHLASLPASQVCGTVPENAPVG